MAVRPMIEVEVVFAGVETQQLQHLSLPAGSTAADAIAAAGLLHAWQPDAETRAPLGRFGRLIAADTVLMAGDRVEILRPLLADPKDQRHQRVKAARRARRRATSG